MTPGFETALEAWLPQYLRRQRWFGGKGRAIADCAIRDLFDLEPDERTVLAICDVAYAEGTPETYTIVVSRRADGVDAGNDDRAIASLIRGFAGSGPVVSRRGGRLEYGDVSEAARLQFDESMPEIAVLGAEQSNTSARVGRSFAFKLFRRLESGENPEIEVSRFLTACTSFRGLPSLDGSITYRAADGNTHSLGVLQGWIENAGDGWAYVTHALSASRRRRKVEIGRLQSDVAVLGVTTAGLHAALESDGESAAFRPELVSNADREAWLTACRDQMARATTLLKSRLGTLPATVRELAGQVSTRVPADIVPQPTTTTFSKIRIHGDYHLGQTLKTRAGFAIMDFEGEPARPLASRRQKSCALKDVAGMLRSFDYAIETTADGDMAFADRLRSTCQLRETFLTAYLGTAGRLGARALPQDRADAAAWLKLFELEKAFYELEYEVNNRPDWVAIPLRGIRAVLSS